MSIEQRIAENTAALIENTALLRQLLDASGGSAKIEPEAKPAKKVKLPKTEPAKEETPEPEPATEVTHETIAAHVRNAFAKATDLAAKKAEWKEILAKFEVKQISQLEGDDLAKLWEEAKTL
jgi:hypothetical protein